MQTTVYPVDLFGPVQPTIATEPIRLPPVNFGDGLLVEEGTTNLVTNPAPASLTGYSALAGSSIALDGTHAPVRSGKAVKVTSGAGATQGAYFTTSSLPSGAVYTFSAWVYVPSGNADVFLAFAGTALPAGAFSAPTSVKDRFARLTVTGTTTATGTAFVEVQFQGSPGAGQVMWIGGFQLEQKAYATSYVDGAQGSTGYVWTGTADASTSTRAAARLYWSQAFTWPLTVVTWARVADKNGGMLVSLDGSSRSPALYLASNGDVGFTSNGDVASPVAAAALNPAVGDLLFMAGTLDSTGKIYTAYAAKGTGAVQTGIPVTSSATPGTISIVDIGTVNGGAWTNSAVEQVLVYNAALSAAEINALAAATQETRYGDDPRIVFAAATGAVRGSLSALAAGGSGMTREDRTRAIAATVRQLSGADPTGLAATHTVTTAAGASGLGVGQYVSLPAGQGYGQVLEVDSLPGVRDILYVKAA